MGITEIKQNVKWRDLIKLSPLEKFVENSLCWPWLIGSLTLAAFGYYLIALPVSALYFITALRQSHNGYHNALGISQNATAFTLYINSMFMLASLHAVKINHIEHHKLGLAKDDYERTVSDMSWPRALLQGPQHWWHNHINALKTATSKEKKNVLLELISIGVFVTCAFIFNIDFLIYHICFMILAELLMPFFTIWVTHHGHDEHSLAHIRRNKWLNKATMNMMLHYEHHLFPAVPTIKLGELTRRIELAEKSFLTNSHDTKVLT